METKFFYIVICSILCSVKLSNIVSMFLYLLVGIFDLVFYIPFTPPIYYYLYFT